MICISASYLVAKFHKGLVMHSRDTGPLNNLGPFGPIVKRHPLDRLYPRLWDIISLHRCKGGLKMNLSKNEQSVVIFGGL